MGGHSGRAPRAAASQVTCTCELVPQPRSAFPRQDISTKVMLKEEQSKEIRCPPFFTLCTWNHSSVGSSLKWEDVVIAMPASKTPIESLVHLNIPESAKLNNGYFADHQNGYAMSEMGPYTSHLKLLI